MNKHTRSVSLIDGHTEEMTNAEVIKALKNCLNDSPSCTTCRHDKDTLTSSECMSALMQDALDLIKRQQAEIERLNKEVDHLSQCVMYQDGQIADAIKEFAERLCEGRVSNDPVVIAVKTELKMMEVQSDDCKVL